MAFTVPNRLINSIQTTDRWERSLRQVKSRQGYEQTHVRTCMHWNSNLRILLCATRRSMWCSRPSASPLSKSSATIMKSLSGASYCSGLAAFACKRENGQKSAPDWLVPIRHKLRHEFVSSLCQMCDDCHRQIPDIMSSQVT